jgi:hypothetical protein
LRGTSGARIVIHDTFVIKQGDRRVGSQGRWLLENDSLHFPAVYDVWDEKYTMERLVPLDVELIDVSAAARKIVALLDRSVWTRRPRVQLNPDDLYARVMESIKLYAPEYKTIGTQVCNEIIRNACRLRAKRVHGDPTIDNLMLRQKTGELVIIDPLPATPYAPDLLAVDLGKILQSASGWEAIRYGFDGRCETLSEVDYLIKDLYGPLEADAAMQFTFVHVVRALPYLSDEIRRSMIDNVLQRLARVLS